MECACRAAVTKLCITQSGSSRIGTLLVWGWVMRVPTGPLFKPFDYALMVVFAMAFIMLTTLRLA